MRCGCLPSAQDLQCQVSTAAYQERRVLVPNSCAWCIGAHCVTSHQLLMGWMCLACPARTEQALAEAEAGGPGASSADGGPSSAADAADNRPHRKDYRSDGSRHKHGHGHSHVGTSSGGHKDKGGIKDAKVSFPGRDL